MTFLLESDLNTYYPKAAGMTEENRRLYLNRANSYAFGYVGGVPPISEALPLDMLKAAVAAAFEILAKGETGADVNMVNGNITEAAPPGPFSRNRERDPLEAVMVMLQPFKMAFESAHAAREDRGIRFL